MIINQFRFRNLLQLWQYPVYYTFDHSTSTTLSFYKVHALHNAVLVYSQKKFCMSIYTSSFVHIVWEAKERQKNMYEKNTNSFLWYLSLMLLNNYIIFPLFFLLKWFLAGSSLTIADINLQVQLIMHNCIMTLRFSDICNKIDIEKDIWFSVFLHMFALANLIFCD